MFCNRIGEVAFWPLSSDSILCNSKGDARSKQGLLHVKIEIRLFMYPFA